MHRVAKNGAEFVSRFGLGVGKHGGLLGWRLKVATCVRRGDTQMNEAHHDAFVATGSRFKRHDR